MSTTEAEGAVGAVVEDGSEPGTEIERQKVGMELLAECEVSDNSLVLPKGITFDQYRSLAVALNRVHDATPFMIGDLQAQGEGMFPAEESAVHSEFTKLSEKTLMYYAAVCKRVPRNRRRPDLGFKHHAAVMKLDAAGQREWLKKAADGGWSATQLWSERRVAEHGERAARMTPVERLREAARKVWSTSVLCEIDDEQGYFIKQEIMDTLIEAAGIPRGRAEAEAGTEQPETPPDETQPQPEQLPVDPDAEPEADDETGEDDEPENDEA